MAVRRLIRKSVEAYGVRRQLEYSTITRHENFHEFPVVFTVSVKRCSDEVHYFTRNKDPFQNE